MHWPAPGVASISRRSAFISSGLSARPERTEWWQANVAEPAVEPARERLRAVLGREIGGEIADEAGEVARRDRRRRFAHHHRAGAEALDDQAERGEFVRMRVDQRRRVGIEIDDQRGQQRLALDAALPALALELLVDDALVRGVLIDDDDAVARSGR